MPYGFLANAVLVIHFGFVVFVAVGGFLVWRYPLLLVVHVPAVGWALGIVTIGWRCPLTGAENDLRERAGSGAYEGGFVDRYLTGLLYPADYEGLVQALLAFVVITAYVGLALRRQRSSRRRASAHDLSRPASQA